MASIRRLGSAVQSAKEHAPGKDYNYAKKVMASGQNKYAVVSDIEQVWTHWVKDKEGKPKPIFCYGPDPDSPSYKDANNNPTGQPVCLMCRTVARMSLSKDARVLEMSGEYEARPSYAANIVDIDDLDWHRKNKHTKLLSTHEDSNFFGQGMATDIYAALVNYGSPEEPADYRTWNNQGLMFVTNKTGAGKQTRYPTTAMPCITGLMAEAAEWTQYDLTGEVAVQTSVKKMVEWLGDRFFQTHGVTQAEIEEASKWIRESEHKRDADEGITPGSTAPTSAPPTRSAAPPKTSAAPVAPSTAPSTAAPKEPSEPAAPVEPSAPSEPSEPQAPEPPPVDPAKEQVVGPDGAMLPPGVRWKMHSKANKPYYWHVSNVSKVVWSAAEASVPQ